MTGSNGQLGQALIRSLPSSLRGEPVQLIASTRSGVGGDIALDLADPQSCQDVVLSYRPNWVINAGAYTAVDKAESEPKLAFSVNAAAPAALAEAVQGVGGQLLQISTDFVFNGRQGTPYQTSQDRDPIGIYGSTKAAGEKLIQSSLDQDQYCILRTSWVYGPVGTNFLLTMLRLQRERERIAVVSDQVGSPTSTYDLARACWKIIEKNLTGIQHWSDAGVATWYDFAVAIGELAQQAGLIDKVAEVVPISTKDYPTPASRPSYSVLDCTNTRLKLDFMPLYWRKALEDVISHLSRSSAIR